ncbi:MAG: glycoside hydrolase family 3 C-terminal domain-containing protein [Promethearchaeota archaeon]
MERANDAKFRDPSAPLERRVADLLSRLTLDEKFALCAGQSFWKTKPVRRLGLGYFKMTDGPHGVGAMGSRFKKATYFPSAVCRAATWNPELSRQFGVALAEEVLSIGFHVILGPGINVHRSPLCGRTFEYQTEDPHLNARLVVPLVQGIQSMKVAACVKHYACNNQETNRRQVDVVVSERTLREIYLPAWEAAVREADAWSVMACYNRVNGKYGCENEDLLVRRLREEWGFRGFVVSDWFAAANASSTAACVKGGLSLEMPGKGKKFNVKALREAFDAGQFTEEELDRNLAGLLLAMFLTGFVDGEASRPKGSRNTPEHQALARRIAEEGIVLLKNEGGLLPLNEGEVSTLAVLGPNAKQKTAFGGGSSMIRPFYEITPLAGIRERSAGKVRLVKDPADADVAIVVAGRKRRWLYGGEDLEGRDNKRLELPGKQVSLIREVARTNPRTVVVLTNGSPVSTGGWLDDVPAVVEAWFAGMEAGRAIAAVLFGDVNPSGKLPLTFPKRIEDSPAHASPPRTFPGVVDGDGVPRVYYDEGVFVGYRHFDARGIEPEFPFGFGLSYTTFEYSDLKVTPATVSGDSEVTVRFSITNAGEVGGAEVAQLYVSDLESSVERPPKELRGFRKVFLRPGETREVSLALTSRDLAFYDESSGQWVVEPGEFEVLVGGSSKTLPLRGRFEWS